LTIWNTRSAQLEYEETFDGQGVIQDLDWSSTPDNQSILAVGFPHRVVIYAQLRYDYLNAGPSWVQIRDVRIRDITPHPIGDSVWLGSGNLVIGAGNQLFIQDETVKVDDELFPSLRMMSRKTASIDIFAAVSRLNGPLPVYHPQLLSQCVLAGKILLVQRILLRLYQKLKFWTEGEELESSLGFSAEDFSEDEVSNRWWLGSSTLISIDEHNCFEKRDAYFVQRLLRRTRARDRHGRSSHQSERATHNQTDAFAVESRTISSRRHHRMHRDGREAPTVHRRQRRPLHALLQAARSERSTESAPVVARDSVGLPFGESGHPS
jgi:hypothetical protein